MFEFPERMMRVFKDEAMQEQFEKDGYVIVPFYSEADIAELNKLYDELHPVEETGFYPSTFSKDKDYRHTADSEIRRIANDRINEIMFNQRVLCGSYIVKYPGPKSVMNVHQDMTLVDETRFTGINIWTPLVDLNDENGVLYMLPGSHRLVPTYRGASIPGLYDHVSKDIIEYMTPLYLKAGEGIIFDQSTIHYSPPNVSEDKRIVTNIYITHKDAEFRTAYYNKDVEPDKIELFEQSDTFATDFEQFGENIFDRPKIGKSLGFYDYDFPKLTIEFLDEHYGKEEPVLEEVKEEQGFFSKIMSRWI